MPTAEEFARQFAAETAANAGFREPPLVDPDHMPPPPKAPDQETDFDEGDDPPHPPWPEHVTSHMSPLMEMGLQAQRTVSTAEAGAEAFAPVEPDLMVAGPQAAYKGQPALLSEEEQAAVGRIVLEAAQRVLREKLDAARAKAPRRRRKAAPAPQPAPETPPKRKRGRPRKIRPEEASA